VSDRWDYDRMFIDGAWTADDIVGVIEVIDPATEEVIGSVPDAGVKATQKIVGRSGRAVAAARMAWGNVRGR
jgi:aldehyde dehydrogenase (NAD+)